MSKTIPPWVVGLLTGLAAGIIMCSITVFGLEDNVGLDSFYAVLPIVLPQSCFVGAMLGWHARKLKNHRRVKMVLFSLIYYLIAAMLSLLMLAFSDTDNQDLFIETLLKALIFGLVGGFMFSVVVLPFVLLTALLIEKFTRNRPVKDATDVVPGAGQ